LGARKPKGLNRIVKIKGPKQKLKRGTNKQYQGLSKTIKVRKRLSFDIELK
jgi:hypothetical protein